KKTNSFETQHIIHHTIDGLIVNEYAEESKTNQTEPRVFMNIIYNSYKLNPFKFLESHFICANEKAKTGVNYIHLLQGLFTYDCDNGFENIYVLFNNNGEMTYNEYQYIFTDNFAKSHQYLLHRLNYYPSLLGLCYHDYIFNKTIQNT